MEPVIKPNANLKSLIGTSVGFIQVNKSWIHHNASFECAAWWEDTEIKTGIYNLVLEQSRFAPYGLKLTAKLDSVVVDDFFPALWAGVAIGNKPYSAKNIGSKRSLFKTFDIVDSIIHTGQIPGSDIDICVHPMIWDSVIDSATDTMLDYQSSMEHYWQDYKTEGNGKFNSNISMIGHCAGNIQALTKAIMDMKRHKEYVDTSEYMSDLYAQNTSWIKVA